MIETDAELLRQHGLRVTQPRLAVLEVLTAQPHADADTVHRALVGTGSGISVQSVHNVLGDLTAVGAVRRFEPERSAARFERRIDDNHHHAVCARCGRVEDVDCVIGAAPCLHAEAPAGFTIQVAEVTFVGVCGNCQLLDDAEALPTPL